MTNYLSNKIRFVSFTSIILILYLHSYNIKMNFANESIKVYKGTFSYIIQDFVSDGICRIAVPIFFTLSGFLFFINIEQFTIRIYNQKIRKRINSLLVPFLIWSGIGILLFALLQLAPESNPYFSRHIIEKFTFVDYLNRWLIYPLTYQLWFLQELMVLSLISPIIYLLVKYVRHSGIIFIIAIWFFDFTIPQLSVFWSDGILFFVLGSYLAILKINVTVKFSAKHLILLGIFWLMLISLKVYFKFENVLLVAYFLRKLSILTGLLFYWFALDRIIDRVKSNKTITYLSAFTFFIYASHEPPLIIVKKLLFSIMGHTEFSHLLIYIASPVLVLTAVISLGIILKKYVNPVYSVLTGSR